MFVSPFFVGFEGGGRWDPEIVNVILDSKLFSRFNIQLDTGRGIPLNIHFIDNGREIPLKLNY